MIRLLNAWTGVDALGLPRSRRKPGIPQLTQMRASPHRRRSARPLILLGRTQMALSSARLFLVDGERRLCRWFFRHLTGRRVFIWARPWDRKRLRRPKVLRARSAATPWPCFLSAAITWATISVIGLTC